MSEAADQVAQSLEAIKTYSFGQSRETLSVVEDLVRDAAKAEDEGEAMADSLVDIALDPATSPDVLQFVCRQIALVGQPKHARKLAPLLLKPETVDAARYAIHPIPGRKVDRVLLDALEDTTDNTVRTGLVNTLAARRVESARPTIAALADSSDPVLAEVSQSALDTLAG